MCGYIRRIFIGTRIYAAIFVESLVEDPATKVTVPRDPKLMWEDMYEQFLDKTLESGYKYKLKVEFANLIQDSRSISRYSMEYQALGTRLQHRDCWSQVEKIL